MSPLLETAVRLGAFFGVLLTLTVVERLFPRRARVVPKSPRWASNLALVVLNTVAVRILIPITAVAAALTTAQWGWGLLQFVVWPVWLEALLAVVAFDLAIYAQHVAFHHVPAMWRLHLVHHADLDLDVTTGLRFHTLEILLSALFKLAVVVVLGPSALAVVIFEVLLNATSMFSHSNLRLPLGLDRLLRWVLVTPDMHRVHHSVLRPETDSNFGFNLPWWDYLFRTYRAQPVDGHDGMTIGLPQLRDERQVDRLPGMLMLPLRAGTQEREPRNADAAD